MFAVAAVIAFAIALILNITGAGKYVLDAELIGLICIAAHLIWPYQPWRSPRA